MSGRSVVSFDEGYHSGAARMRQHIIDAIRERANAWAQLHGREEAAQREAMYEVAQELEDGRLAPVAGQRQSPARSEK